MYLLYCSSVLSIPLMVDVFDVFAILHQCAAGWWMIGCDRSVASHKEALSGLLTQIYLETEKKIWQIYFVERSPYTDILWKENLTNIFWERRGSLQRYILKRNLTTIFWDRKASLHRYIVKLKRKVGQTAFLEKRMNNQNKKKNDHKSVERLIFSTRSLGAPPGPDF